MKTKYLGDHEIPCIEGKRN